MLYLAVKHRWATAGIVLCTTSFLGKVAEKLAKDVTVCGFLDEAAAAQDWELARWGLLRKLTACVAGRPVAVPSFLAPRATKTLAVRGGAWAAFLPWGPISL